MRKPHLIQRDGAFIADDATVTGEVTLGEGVSVWYGTVIRGDVCSISIGARTNIQDSCVIHPMTGQPVELGEDITVGHAAVIHCRSVGDRCLIGIGSILLTGARIGDDCIVAAGSLVTENTEVPPGSVVMGTPARVVRTIREDERKLILAQSEKYIRLARSHLEGAAPFDWRNETWPPL